jgi:hypothetical protein
MFTNQFGIARLLSCVSVFLRLTTGCCRRRGERRRGAHAQVFLDDVDKLLGRAAHHVGAVPVPVAVTDTRAMQLDDLDQLERRIGYFSQQFLLPPGGRPDAAGLLPRRDL